MKYQSDLMEKLITPQRCCFSENTNKHRCSKNPNGNTGVKDTAVAADDRSDPTPNQSSVENPSTDTNTNNDKKKSNQNQHQ